MNGSSTTPVGGEGGEAQSSGGGSGGQSIGARLLPTAFLEDSCSLSSFAILHGQDLASVTDAVVERIRTDAEFASLVANQMGLPGGAALRTVEEIIDNDEDYSVEFKSTARWDLREGKPNKAMEDAVVKTVAGLLNTDGGTLLIGVDNSGTPVGLDHDYQRVQPKNGDGFVNWLTTHLINALGHTPVARIRARITTFHGKDICRVDVAGHTEPVWAKTSKEARIFFARFNNSTRAIPDDEATAYVNMHWRADPQQPQDGNESVG
jgi:type I restriction enzyme, R subunit